MTKKFNPVNKNSTLLIYAREFNLFVNERMNGKKENFSGGKNLKSMHIISTPFVDN
jgi:hypothetical protein